jgi:hypothetical protein
MSATTIAVAVSVETPANVVLVVLVFDNDTPPNALYQSCEHYERVTTRRHLSR